MRSLPTRFVRAPGLRTGLVTLLAGLLLLVASPALAHAVLLSSSPAGGSTVSEAPDEIRLEFNEPIEASFGGVQVFNPAGERIQSGDPQISGSTVTVSLSELEEAGSYTVVFRIIGADSHPVESRFAFEYRPPEPSPEPEPSPTGPEEPTEEPAGPGDSGTGPTPLDVQLETAGEGSTVGLWISRLVNYVALTAVVGLLVGAGFLASPGSHGTRRRLLKLAVVGSGLWVVSGILLFVYGLSVAAAQPLPQAINAELAATFFDTRLGRAVVVQTLLAVGVLATTGVARKKGSRNLLLLSLALTGLAAFAPGYWGHAATSDLPVVGIASDWVHVVAVTAWVGGLAALALVVLGSDEEGPWEPARRFSRVAGVAVFVVLGTGVVNALMRISSPGELFGTQWGRLVVLKLLLFAVVAGLGWRNRNRILPLLQKGGARARGAFKRMAVVELVFMLAAIGTAAGLASTITSDAEAAQRIQTVVTNFGEGQINLTVDPATVGQNVMHLYFLDSTGRQMEVTDASLQLLGPEDLDVRLFEAGPGHYTALSQQIPTEGQYRVRVSAAVDAQPTEATGSITVR